MLTRFFPPKWRLRIVVLEILMIAFGLMQFAKTFDDITNTPKSAQNGENTMGTNGHNVPTKAEVQAQLVQQILKKYDNEAIIQMPLTEDETKAIEASLRNLADELTAQTLHKDKNKPDNQQIPNQQIVGAR